MKKLVLVTLLCFTSLVFSQSKGTVSGKVIDKEMNNEPLPFANVFIKGTTIGGTTDFDGNYSLNVPEGAHTIVFSFVGYKTEERAITVKANETLSLNVTMGASEGVALEEVKIKGTTSREKESALLLEQKKAVSIKTSIGAQELARKGVGDVATAVTKTTGISKQEGTGTVFVRGLGDRYNVTTLNELPLPSNNPSKKNIDLSFFSTDIVGYIGLDKTYSSRNYGDFGGANIDIVSKTYKGNGFLEVSLATGANSEAAKQDKFYGSDGPSSFGFYKTNYPAFPLNNYNFKTSWDRKEVGTPINSSVSVKGGDSFEFGESKLSFFAVAGFDNKYSYKAGVARANVNVSGVSRRDLSRESYTYDTNTTFMGNIRFKTGGHEFKYNGLMINTSSDTYDDYQGIYDVFDNAPEGGAVIQRQTFVRNTLYVHQLLGNHKLVDNFKVQWGAAYNFNKNNVPDRKQSTVLPRKNDEPNGSKSMFLISNDSDNHRFFSDLEEEEIAANARFSYEFAKNADDEYKAELTLGYSGRFKNVDFDATQFNFAPIINVRDITSQPIIEDVYNLDSYFNQENFNAGYFQINTFRGGLGATTNVLLPQTYGGDQSINAGYLELKYNFSERLSGILGVRGEAVKQTLNYDTSVIKGESELDEFQFLPSLSLKYTLNDENNLKFAASKTYTLPQFKERAPFLFEDVVNTSLGNTFLYSSDNYNVDFKWEYFPKRDEVISAGVFGKYIKNPINEVTINSASNDISYVNTGDWGQAYGVELEVKKTLLDKESDDGLKNKLSFGLNASYMNHNQELNKEKVIAENPGLSVDFSKEEDGFAGASDILLNSDLTYFKDFKNGMNLQTTLVYNYFSDRIFALGTDGKGNLVDKGFSTLDLVLKSNITKKLKVGASFKNLLNPEIKRFQDNQNVTVLSFKRGVNFKLSLSYNF